MNRAFDQIFKAVQDTLEQKLGAARAGELSSEARAGVQGSGEIPLDFTLDQNGNASYETAQYGAGKTVHCVGVITGPDDTFSITIKSSDGGGGHWDNVRTNQQFPFDLQTSFWHKTQITVQVHAATARNKPGHGVLKYTY